MSTKNIDYFSLAENTRDRYAKAVWGYVVLTANETTNKPHTFRSLRQAGAYHVAVFLHRNPPWLGRENIPPVAVPYSFVVFFLMSI